MGICKNVGIILFCIWFYRMYTLLGFRHSEIIEKHFEGFECNLKLEGKGAEDIATTKNGIAFITSGNFIFPFFSSSFKFEF